MSEILYGSIASLLVFGGIDSRPRIGGNVVETALGIGKYSDKNLTISGLQ